MSPLKQYIIQDVISLVNIDVQVKDLEYETWKLRGRVQVLKIWNCEVCFTVSRGKAKIKNKKNPTFSVIVIYNTYNVPATRVLT